jgi:hypothetical protein
MLCCHRYGKDHFAVTGGSQSQSVVPCHFAVIAEDAIVNQMQLTALWGMWMVVPIVKRLTVRGKPYMTDHHGGTLMSQSTPFAVVLHEPAGLNRFFGRDDSTSPWGLERTGDTAESRRIFASMLRGKKHRFEQLMRLAPLTFFDIASEPKDSTHD